MDQNRKKSTRLWLLIIGIGMAVLKEVLGFYEIEITTETLLTVEGMILATAGLDTVRPLGKGKEATPEATPEA